MDQILRQIEEAIKTKATMLNLRHWGVYTLPKEIGDITNITDLDLSENQLEKLPTEFKNLTNLKRLNLGLNRFREMPKEIFEITSLKELLINRNYIQIIPPEISNLTNLTYLELSGNAITSVSPEIGKLIDLEDLSLRLNKIKSLPFEITNLVKIRHFNIEDNPLQIPPEILQRNPQQIIRYVASHNRQSLNEAKFLVVGQGSVGKTSLVQRILHNVYDQDQNKTEGIVINQWQVDGHEKREIEGQSKSKIKNLKSEIRLNIWDFGGQEIMHATHQFFLTKRSLYLLVLDSRLTQEENRVEYWLKIIQSFGEESPVLIVGNKTDQHPLDIDRTGLQKKYPNIVGILETSAATGKGIEELKAEIAKQVDTLPHARDLLPETWFTVKSKLEELAKNKNFFTQDEYFELCNSNKVSDETSKHTLMGFLHDLGVVLHFQDDPRLANLGILNPQWVTNGVYKILNSHELFQNQGKLSLSLLNQILDLPEYPSNKRLFIVDMMKKFELCYDIEPDKEFLIPDLLPKDEPFTGEWGDALAFQIHYNVLPSSIISRFIVRMNEFIHKTIWRSGVVLKRDENTALVKADIEDKKIYIWVSGVEETRRDLLAIIRAEFEKIHKTITKIEATEKVPVPNIPEAIPVDYEFLVRMANEGRESLPVQAGNQIIDLIVKKVLSRIETKSKNYQLHIHGDVIGGNIISGDENKASVENIEEKKPRKKKS